METLHQVIEGRVLSRVLNLPMSFQNIMVEITVTPVVKDSKPMITRDGLRAHLNGSHTEILSGILKKQSDVTDITLEELRQERRIKYEHID